MKFEVLLKPTGMAKKLGRTRPEFEVKCEAGDKNEAARLARLQAEADGFRGYAVTKIKELSA